MGEVDLRAVCEWPIAMEHRDRDAGGPALDDPLRNRKGTKYYLRVNGRKKIGLYPIEDRLGRYFMAELGGRQCRIDTPCFLRKNKVGGGGPDRTADPRLMSSSEIISLAKKPQ